MAPLGVDEDGFVLAYQESTYDQGGAVWRIDPKSYEKTKLFQNPAESGEMESKFSPDYSEIHLRSGPAVHERRLRDKPSGSYDGTTRWPSSSAR